MSGSESLHMFSNKKLIMLLTVYCKHWILTCRLDPNLFWIRSDIFLLMLKNYSVHYLRGEV